MSEGRKAGNEPEAILKDIDNAYPFGQRSNYPYKAWLLERKRFIRALGLEKPMTPDDDSLFTQQKEQTNE